MANTLVPGQRVLVDRIVYRYRSVHRGNIIVFHRPGPPHDVLIKRVVGLPGDLLSVHGGHLFINGVRANDSFVDKVHGITEPTDPADPYASTDPDAPWSLAQPFPRTRGQLLRDGRQPHRLAGQPLLGHRARATPSSGAPLFTYWPLGRLGDL